MKILALLVLTIAMSCACVAQTITAGRDAPGTGACFSTVNVGNIYVRSEDPTIGPVGVFRCTQVSPTGFSWQPVDHLVVASLPSTCTPGDIAFLTTASAGQNLNICTASPGTWSEITSGGGASGWTYNSGANTIIAAGGSTVTIPNLTVSGAASSGAQCLQVSSAGAVSGTGNPCGSGGGGANASGYYWVGQTANSPANAVNIGGLSTGLLKISVSGGVATPSTAVSGTDYAVTGADLNTSSQVTSTHLASALPVIQGGTGLTAGSVNKVLGGSAPSYVTVTSSYVDSSIALTGTDINTSNQVTATHLASALPVLQGGTGLTAGSSNKVLGGATPSYVTITSAYVDNSIALTGTDINTSNQVTATHLASALPNSQGGTGTTSTLTGIVRGGSAFTAGELSGDATTTGSNAVTVKAINGTLLSGLATGLLKNTTSTGVPSIAVSGTDYMPGSAYSTQSSTSTGNISAVTMVSSASATHLYLFAWTVSLTAAGVGCSNPSSTTVNMNVIFTDPNTSGSVTETLGTVTLATNGNGTVGFLASGVDNVLAKSGTSVQYSTSSYTAGSGCSTNPTYQVSPALVQVF